MVTLSLAATVNPLPSGLQTLAGVGLALPFAVLCLEFPTIATLILLRPPAAIAGPAPRSTRLS